MIIGKVIGNLVATKKSHFLEGFKFLIVKQLKIDLEPTSSFVVAVDTVGAGAGEIVMVVSGSSARLTDVTKNKPVDAAVIAIIDNIDLID